MKHTSTKSSMLTQHDTGLDARQFNEVKRHMLTTGEFDPELWDSLNPMQQFWVNETKKTLRDLSRR